MKARFYFFFKPRAKRSAVLCFMFIPTSLSIAGYKAGEENKILTAADTIWAEIPFKSECRITDPWSEKESGNFFFLKKEIKKKKRRKMFKNIKKFLKKEGLKALKVQKTHKNKKCRKQH